MSYPTEKLGKYIDILSGFAFKSKDFSDTGVPVIKIKNVTPPYVSLEDVSYIPKDIVVIALSQHSPRGWKQPRRRQAWEKADRARSGG